MGRQPLNFQILDSILGISSLVLKGVKLLPNCHIFIRYEILRDKLLLEMLRHHIGEGMWTVLSEDEQQERIMQLKMRVQRLRKDGKLDGTNSLPGAGLTYTSNLLALMGFSRIGEEVQHLNESEKIKQMEQEGKCFRRTNLNAK